MMTMLLPIYRNPHSIETPSSQQKSTPSAGSSYERCFKYNHGVAEELSALREECIAGVRGEGNLEIRPIKLAYLKTT